MPSAARILLKIIPVALCLCIFSAAWAQTAAEPPAEVSPEAGVPATADEPRAPQETAASHSEAAQEATPTAGDPAVGVKEAPAAGIAPGEAASAGRDTGAVLAPADQPVARDLVLVIDNSGSMKKNDPGFLTRAAVTSFIERLDALARVALVVFDEEVRMPIRLSELTPEAREQILASLNGIKYTGKFTDSPAAVERAMYELKNNGRADAQKLIVFMTDGIVDTGNAAADVERTKWLREDLAPDAAEAGIRIFAIAFTDAADFQLIQSIAQNTKGEYFRALVAEDLPAVFESISTLIDKSVAPVEAPAPEPAAEPPVVAPPPVVAEAPAPAPEPVNKEESIRSLWMIGSGVVLIVALLAIILLLLRQSRSSRGPDEKYVAEAYLNDSEGVTGQAQYKLGAKPTMIGRVAGRDTDHLDYVVIPQSTIGRRHALIEYKDFGYWIMDQGSINGTFVNGRPVTSETRLKHGDKVRLHKIEFEFLMPEMGDAGKTVLSHTQFTGQGAGIESEEEATVLKDGPGRSKKPEESPPAQEEEVLFDITGGPAEARQFLESEEATVVPSGKARAAAAPASPAGDDETLMPARPSSGGVSSGDVTLMPGTRTGAAEDEADSEDETLLPDSGKPDETEPRRK